MSTDILQNIKYHRTEQKDIVNSTKGYINFLRDNKNNKYLQFYVSQSIQISYRVQQHIHSLIKRSLDAFHYYIHTLSKGRRNTNFIHLYQLRQPQDLTEDDRSLLLNFLEILMTITLYSLPQDIHNKFSTNPMSSKSVSIHLNILNPLKQTYLPSNNTIHKT